MLSVEGIKESDFGIQGLATKYCSTGIFSKTILFGIIRNIYHLKVDLITDIQVTITLVTRYGIKGLVRY